MTLNFVLYLIFFLLQYLLIINEGFLQQDARAIMKLEYFCLK
jgi:hypothetical protein